MWLCVLYQISWVELIFVKDKSIWCWTNCPKYWNINQLSTSPPRSHALFIFCWVMLSIGLNGSYLQAWSYNTLHLGMACPGKLLKKDNDRHIWNLYLKMTFFSVFFKILVPLLAKYASSPWKLPGIFNCMPRHNKILKDLAYRASLPKCVFKMKMIPVWYHRNKKKAANIFTFMQFQYKSWFNRN